LEERLEELMSNYTYVKTLKEEQFEEDTKEQRK
jgi:hypothetical protein